MGRYRSRDGQWTVEVVTLSCTPNNRDGSWVRLRRYGYYWADVRDPSELAAWVDLAELEALDGA
jgi:hypothetical protein